MAGWKSRKLTRIGSVERGYYKACTGVIRKKSYELV